MKSFVSLISKPFKKEDTGKIIPSSSPTSTASLNTIISSPVIAVSNGTPNTSSKIPSSPSNMNNDTINTSQKITTVASNNNSVYYTRDIDSSIDDSTHLCPPSNGVLAAAALKSSEPQEKADSEFVPINRQNSFSYDSVNQPKADWNDIELRCENAKQAILGYGSFGTVIKAYWKHPSHFKLNHEDCYKDETCRDGEIVVAIKLFTRGLTGPEDLNITKLYQQACDEVNLVKSAEQRMFDTSRIVQAFGIAKGPLTAEMCRVFRVQEGEESIGILMRYEAGGALEHIVHNSSKTTLPMTGIERIRLLLEIAQGIAELHSSGIVHADIKLDNVLLSHHRPPKVRLADFGLSIFKSEEESKLGNSALMMTRHLRGTPIYCAPELLTNPFEQSTNTETIIAKPSRKTDMYAFAIVAWEILSQNQPFAEIRAEGELCTRVHQGHRPPVSELPTDTSPNILAMIESCWDKDRNARKTAVECVRLLQYEYVSLKKGVFDIYFSHASVPKLLLSHIYYYFVRLGCTVSTGLGFSSLTEPLSPTSYLNTPCTFSEDSLNSKLVILCFDKEYQQSLRCMRELEEFKHTYPDKQILTLVVEEKLMAWANERSKEMLLLQSPAHTVDIGHIGRAHWESDEGPDAAMLVALTKNLEPLRELVIKSECVSLTGQLTQGSRLGSK